MKTEDLTESQKTDALISEVSMLLKHKKQWIKENTDVNHRAIPMSDVQFNKILKYIRLLEKRLEEAEVSRNTFKNSQKLAVRL